LAQFGRLGIVKEIASNITAQFASNLKVKLVPEVLGPSSVTSEFAHATAAPQLNMGSVFWKMLKQRLKRWLGRA